MSKFVLNRKGVRELFLSDEMKAVISEYSSSVCDNAGGGSKGYTFNVQAKNRAVGRVYAFNETGSKDNNENNTLLKSLHD